MNLDRIGRSVLFAGLAAILGGCASMDDAPADGGSGGAAAEDPMAEMMAEMQAWMALHEPNENHEWLRGWEGSYDCAGRMWASPEMPPMEMTGSSVITPVLDGRYLREDFQGDFMGQAFSGMALIGYDNQEEEFFSIWFDSGSTNYMVSRGHRREDGVLEMSGDMAMPDGTDCAMRLLLRRTGGDGMTMEMYQRKAGGDEIKHMEFTYTKRKP